MKSPVEHLWSISVEELFYAIWPLLSKISGAALFWVGVAILPFSLSLAYYAPSKTWYNPLVQFFFFAAGCLVAFRLHNKRWSLIKPVRVLVFSLGVAAWLAIPPLYGYFPVRFAEPAGFVLNATACILVFLSILGMPVGRILQPFVYLGKISYGLYVFHLPWLQILQVVVVTRVSHKFVIHLVAGFLLTVGTAAL